MITHQKVVRKIISYIWYLMLTSGLFSSEYSSDVKHNANTQSGSVLEITSFRGLFKPAVRKHTGAVGVTLTTCGEIPETGTAPLGGRFLLVTDAQENGCGKTEHRRHLGLMDNRKIPALHLSNLSRLQVTVILHVTDLC